MRRTYGTSISIASVENVSGLFAVVWSPVLAFRGQSTPFSDYFRPVRELFGRRWRVACIVDRMYRPMGSVPHLEKKSESIENGDYIFLSADRRSRYSGLRSHARIGALMRGSRDTASDPRPQIRRSGKWGVRTRPRRVGAGHRAVRNVRRDPDKTSLINPR